MARLPCNIYEDLRAKQRENYKLGLDNTLTLGEIYEVFRKAGYKQSTANKWLLNWAICLCVKFEDPKGNKDYRVRFGDFRDMGYTPNDMLCGGTVWLPCKEVWIKKGDKAICTIL